LAEQTPREAALVALAARGDDAAFGEIVRLRQATLRGLLRRWCGNAALADDLAQDVFVQAWRNLHRLEKPAAFGGWLRQIALNVWLQHARKSKLPLRDLDDDAPAEPAIPGASESNIDLERALDRLSAGERLCVLLSHAEGMSHAEIARAVDLPLGTVKSHIARGTAKLRGLLGSA
jgi:RNA polymerase sigma-70 factor (ECF subfamily)